VYQCSIDRVTNPNPFYSHSYTWQYSSIFRIKSWSTQIASIALLAACFLLTTCLAYSSILTRKQQLPPKENWTSTRPHGVTPQKTLHFSVSTNCTYVDYTASNIFHVTLLRSMCLIMPRYDVKHRETSTEPNTEPLARHRAQLTPLYLPYRGTGFRNCSVQSNPLAKLERVKKGITVKKEDKPVKTCITRSCSSICSPL
jgi:hypothetical protein